LKRLFIALLVGMLDMVPALAQEAAPGADYFVEAVVDNSTPFVGQQVTYTFRLYHAVDLENLLFQPAGFEGFSRAAGASTGQGALAFTRSYAAVADGRQYQVSELDTILFPLRAGGLDIAPSVLLLAETVFRDEQELSTNPVQIEVQPLPDNAPAEFNGAVGRFEMQAVLDRASATLGEPITLRLTVTGSGNFEQLAPPELPTPAGWRVYQNRATQSTGVTGGLLVGEKTFEWLIVPNETGTQNLPEVSLTFFDPETLTYRSVSTSPVTLEIFPAEGESSQLPSVLDEVLGQLPRSLKPVPAAIQATELYPGIGFWLLWLLPPCGAGLSWMWAMHQRHKRVDRVKIRQSIALRRAQRHLQNAQKLRSNDACRVMSEAIFLYFADQLDTVATGLTQADVTQAMQTQGIDESLLQRVAACLELADEGRYAPIDSVDIQLLRNDTLDVLIALDRHWNAA
jgi:hypothetical protein